VGVFSGGIGTMGGRDFRLGRVYIFGTPGVRSVCRIYCDQYR
jgi:hypothetical protein